MSLQAYYDNKQKARELFKKAIELKCDNPEKLPMWKLRGRLEVIIAEMGALGYHTKFEDVNYKSNGGKVWELENLKLLHEFTEVLKIKTTSIGFADYFKIYRKLAEMDHGCTCRKCGGSGDYRRSSGVMDDCIGCAGTGRDIEINESLLEDLKEVSL